MSTLDDLEPYAGGSDADRAVWFAYFAAASASLTALHTYAIPAGLKSSSDRKANPSLELIAALQSVTASAFALEFRMKRVLSVLKVKSGARAVLANLLDCFWCWLRDVKKWKGTQLCAPPGDWNDDLVEKLHELRDLRNAIVHGDAKGVQKTLGTNPLHIAATHYNNVVDAIRLINWGTGYTNDQSVSLSYWEELKLAVSGSVNPMPE